MGSDCHWRKGPCLKSANADNNLYSYTFFRYLSYTQIQAGLTFISDLGIAYFL